jgi:hypothetical protein
MLSKKEEPKEKTETEKFLDPITTEEVHGKGFNKPKKKGFSKGAKEPAKKKPAPKTMQEAGFNKPKPKPKAKAKPKPKTKSKNQKKAYVVGVVGPQGAGKTKLSGDFSELLKENEKMLYFDSEGKADKVLDEWFDLDKIDIINFTKIDKDTGKTLKRDTLDAFEASFIKDWIPKLKSGVYKFLVVDKGNVFWKMGKDYYYQTVAKPQPAQFAWGVIYALVLERIFEPMINICREYDVNLILCFNIKGKYANDQQIGVKANVDNGEELLGYLDYYLWLEQDYEKFVFKHPTKAFWTLRDEDINVTKYLFNRKFILEGEPVLNKYGIEITRTFKRYSDFMEDTVLTTYEKRIRSKTTKATTTTKKKGFGKK